MDRAKLRSQVFDKTGIKVDIDDPIFALVALNEAVLEETVDRHLERIEAASLELAQHARHAGGLPQAHHATHPAAAAPVPPAAAGARPIATQAAMFSPRELRLLGAAAGISLLTALLVLAGQALFAKAPALTAQQQAAIATAEKLERALPRLDEKTRTALEAELKKP